VRMRRIIVMLCAVAVLVGFSVIASANVPSPVVTATVTGPTSVELSWEPASGETTGYEIIRGRADMPGWLPSIGTVSANVYSFTDNTVEPNTNYVYAVAPIYIESISHGMTYTKTTITTPAETGTKSSAATTTTTTTPAIQPTTTTAPQPTVITPTQTTSQNTRQTKVTIGSNQIMVNGNPVTLDAAPEIKNGRTMVPLRAISEALGATIEWDELTQTATITLK